MFDDINKEVSEVSLKTLTDKANKMVELEELVEEKQASLKATQKELKTLIISIVHFQCTYKSLLGYFHSAKLAHFLFTSLLLF